MKVKGFIKVTTYATVTMWDAEEDKMRSEKLEEFEYIAVNDIARVSKGGITLKTYLPDGDNYLTVRESVEEVLKLIEEAQTDLNGIVLGRRIKIS